MLFIKIFFLLTMSICSHFASELLSRFSPPCCSTLILGLSSRYPIFKVAKAPEFHAVTTRSLLEMSDKIKSYNVYSRDKKSEDWFGYGKQSEKLRAIWQKHVDNPDFLHPYNIVDAHLLTNDTRFLPECLMGCTQHRGTVVLSSKSTYTHLHIDSSFKQKTMYCGSWMHLVEGEKTWFFIHRDHLARIMTHDDLTPEKKFQEFSIDDLAKRFYKNLEDGSAYICTMQGGDFLFFNANEWYHAVQTTKATLGTRGEIFRTTI